MQIDIRSNVREVSRWLTDAQKKQVPFATILAMTMTAKDVKAEEILTMKRVFDRPTPYALNALRVKPATKQSLIASVEFKEFGGTPAKRFLNPEVHGGARSRKSHERQLGSLMRGASYAIPGNTVPRDAYGNVKGAFFKRVLSQLKVSTDPFQNVTGSKRSKRGRKSSAFFIPKKGGAVYERKGRAITPVLIFTRAPVYRKRFPFYEIAAKVVAAKFAPNFKIAFERAMASSNARGTWR